MKVAERHPSSDYALGPPWLFRGSALYQLHLVKADTARAFIPKNLKLVEAFGYTLGGFFLAHYDGSPAGIFDELVVIAGIVWNPPTSCAWAARVLVNSDEACKHGQKEIGLPSHVGIFSKRAKEIKGIHIDKPSRFLDTLGLGSAYRRPKQYSDIQVSEIKGSSPMTLCNISLPFVASNKWMGPAIRVSLPSFSGETIHNPHLLKYSCHIECRVRPVEAAKILGPSKVDPDKCCNGFEPDDGNLKAFNDGNPKANVSEEDDAWNRSISVLLSKPILALEFSLLKMQVDAPTVLLPHT